MGSAPGYPRASAASRVTRRGLFETGRVCVAVECPSGADLLWLEEFLAPTFRMCSAARAVDYTVEAVVDGDLYQRLAATRPPGVLPEAVTFVLDQGALTAPWWLHPARRQRVLADSAHGVLYVVPEGVPRAQIVGRVGGRLFRGAMMRIVREIAMARAWTRTRMVLHAAAVAIGGRSVLIAGPKRAGKSSLLIHCLRAPGAAYVSNDRILLSLAAAAPTARGLPAIVSLRRGTLDLFPELSRSVAGHDYRAHLTMTECEAGPTTPPMPLENGDMSISPAQLCRLLHVSAAGEVPVGAVVLPRVDLGSPGMRVQPLSPDEAARYFDAVVFAAGSEVRVSEVFRAGRGRPPGDLAEARALWSRLTRRVPAFECRIGRGAFDELPAPTVLRAILRTLEAVPAWS